MKRKKQQRPPSSGLTGEETGTVAGYLDRKILQASRALDKAEQAVQFDPTPFAMGQIQYWRNVISGLHWALTGLGRQYQGVSDGIASSLCD